MKRQATKKSPKAKSKGESDGEDIWNMSDEDFRKKYPQP